MPSMLRALAWKEWREQRPVLLAGIALAITMPLFVIAGASLMQRHLDLTSLADALPAIFMGILFPLFAAAAGAATFAGERGEGTLGFLLSRPASRATVWGVKVTVAAASILGIASGSLAVAWVFRLLAQAEGSFITALQLMERPVESEITLLFALGATFLLFTTSIFFSTVLSRTMNAATAGLAVSLLILAGIFLVWSRLDLVPRLEPAWMTAEMVLAGCLLLLASLYAFARGELLSGRGVRGAAILGALLILTGISLVALPLLYAQAQLSPSTAVLFGPVLNAAGDAVVTTAAPSDQRSSQVWLIHTDGSGMERLTGRLAAMPSFSPDGRFIAYFSWRGLLGLRSDEIQLRAIQPDGARDHLLAGDIRVPVTPRFSPDASRLALTRDNELRIISTDGAPELHVPLEGRALEWSALGWTSDGAEVHLIGTRWGPERHTVLAAVNVSTGQSRILHEADASWAPGMESRSPMRRARRRYPLVLFSELREKRLDLVDIAGGQVETLTRQACPASTGSSEDDRFLAYAVCIGQRLELPSTEIYIRDLQSGQDRLIATLKGTAAQVLLSPAGDRVTVHRRIETEPLRTVTIDMKGSVREWESPWVPLGWSGRDRVVLADARWEATHLAVGDAGTGELREIFPVPESP